MQVHAGELRDVLRREALAPRGAAHALWPAGPARAAPGAHRGSRRSGLFDAMVVHRSWPRGAWQIGKS